MIILVARGRGRGRGRGRRRVRVRGRDTRGGGRGAGSLSDLRRSNCVKEKDRSNSVEEIEKEFEEKIEEEVVLDSSQQIASQPSSTEQSLSQLSPTSQQIASQPSSTEQSLPQRSSSQDPFTLKVNLPLQSDVNNPPLIIDPTERDIIIRSRSHTPIMDPKTMNAMSEIMSPTATQQSQRSTPSVEIPSRVTSDDRLNNIEAILIKQGKQNRIIYELQKLSYEKISSLQTQIKKLSSDKSNQLSQKVFNVSNNLVCIILSH